MHATAFQRLHHPALNPDNIIFVAGQTVTGDWPPVKVLHWYAPPPDFSETGDPRVDSAMRFAAPEQLQTGETDVRSEIYSLGATMWFLLTGAPPAVMNADERTNRFATEKLRGVPKIVRHLLGRMLRADPAERPQDPVALAAYLQTCLSRVERRERMEQRFGVQFLAQAKVAVANTRLPIPAKPLAWAAAILLLGALALLFLPRPFAQPHSSSVAAQSVTASEDLPNEIIPPRNDLAGRPVETERSVHSATPAIGKPASVEAERQRVATKEPLPPSEGPDETGTPATVAENVPPKGLPREGQRH